MDPQVLPEDEKRTGVFHYLFGGSGKNLLTRLEYSANPGFCLSFFSSIGIPETYSIKKVIVSGPMIVHHDGLWASDMIQIHHQSVTSPK